MREIKFRVFDSNTDEMIATDVRIGDISYYDFDGDNITEQKGLIIMQYTGLKDKNGVEIYESDVVNVNKPWIKPRIEVVNFYTVGGKAGVHPFTDTEHQWTSYTAEVIGNIYEHPHLLEVSE